MKTTSRKNTSKISTFEAQVKQLQQKIKEFEDMVQQQNESMDQSQLENQNLLNQIMTQSQDMM